MKKTLSGNEGELIVNKNLFFKTLDTVLLTFDHKKRRNKSED
jgi:hypothetical protein